jgi:hypothetical protein
MTWVGPRGGGSTDDKIGGRRGHKIGGRRGHKIGGRRGYKIGGRRGHQVLLFHVGEELFHLLLHRIVQILNPNMLLTFKKECK